MTNEFNVMTIKSCFRQGACTEVTSYNDNDDYVGFLLLSKALSSKKRKASSTTGPLCITDHHDSAEPISTTTTSKTVGSNISPASISSMRVGANPSTKCVRFHVTEPLNDNCSPQHRRDQQQQQHQQQQQIQQQQIKQQQIQQQHHQQQQHQQQQQQQQHQQQQHQHQQHQRQLLQHQIRQQQQRQEGLQEQRQLHQQQQSQQPCREYIDTIQDSTHMITARRHTLSSDDELYQRWYQTTEIKEFRKQAHGQFQQTLLVLMGAATSASVIDERAATTAPVFFCSKQNDDVWHRKEKQRRLQKHQQSMVASSSMNRDDIDDNTNDHHSNIHNHRRWLLAQHHHVQQVGQITKSPTEQQKRGGDDDGGGLLSPPLHSLNDETRGLEQFFCLERRRRKSKTIRSIIKAYQKLNKEMHHDVKLSLFAFKCNSWATELAIEEAIRDYQKAYRDEPLLLHQPNKLLPDNRNHIIMTPHVHNNNRITVDVHDRKCINATKLSKQHDPIKRNDNKNASVDMYQAVANCHNDVTIHSNNYSNDMLMIFQNIPNKRIRLTAHHEDKRTMNL